jgi:AcrR family transcriptional regulator
VRRERGPDLRLQRERVTERDHHPRGLVRVFAAERPERVATLDDPDHDSLLAAAFEAMALEEIDEVTEALASDRDPLAQLREITEPYGPGGGEEAYRFWLEAWAEAFHSPKLQETSKRLSHAWHDLVVGVIERGIAAGVFHCDHPHETAWMVVALSDAYALQTQIGSGLDADEMNHVLWRLTERELGLPAGTLARPRRPEPANSADR